MKPKEKRMMISGGIMTLAGPFIGLLGTVIGMMGAFSTLGKSGVGDPHMLASKISGVLMMTWIGLFIGGVGFVLLLTGFILWMLSRGKSIPS